MVVRMSYGGYCSCATFYNKYNYEYYKNMIYLVGDTEKETHHIHEDFFKTINNVSSIAFRNINTI